MNNKEKYQRAVDQIQASDILKQKTIEKIKGKINKGKIMYMRILVACAVFLLIFSGGLFYINQEEKINNTITLPVAKVNPNLPRFKNMEEVKTVLKKQNLYETNGLLKGEIIADSVATGELKESMQSETTLINSANRDQSNLEYSSTNVQVENVDEADIVKTDGEYIYYLTNNQIYIISAANLDEIAKIDLSTDKEKFFPREIYVKENKLIILANTYIHNEEELELKRSYTQRIIANDMAKAIILDITDKTNPIEVRSISLDGYYVNSRMIGDNLYFISNKYPNYYNGMLDNEILPLVKDSNGEDRIIACTDIAYFEGTNSHSFMTVAGFNINENSEVYTETFFGASDNIYCSQNNLYITQMKYQEGINTIYKFNLNDSQIILQAKGEVKGYINNQFSMDEYEDYLRIATTDGYDEESTNGVYILDENLKEISRIDNLAKGEKIYAVRFIGKIGYVVTFKQIDPLFVLDLSDPFNPIVKGELKIPGYSSYLHPYDETHIIGIGYNTKSNGYGGVTNANMKMSMFDVSDLENPVEMFSIDIGDRYANSPVTYNHKALFYNKSKNLIGFPIELREYNTYNDRNGFIMFNIDLENGFQKHGEILQKIDYQTNIDRAIYIGDWLYTLAENKIVKYDLNTFDKLEEIDLF